MSVVTSNTQGERSCWAELHINHTEKPWIIFWRCLDVLTHLSLSRSAVQPHSGMDEQHHANRFHDESGASAHREGNVQQLQWKWDGWMIVLMLPGQNKSHSRQRLGMLPWPDSGPTPMLTAGTGAPTNNCSLRTFFSPATFFIANC